MAKINRVIVAIKKAMEDNNMCPQKGKRTTKAATKNLLCLFSTIEDVRMQRKIDYPLGYILLIAFLAILGNANTWAEIEDFGKSKERWLQKFIDVDKYGIPSHDTFRRVFGLIATSELQKIVVDILSENLKSIRNCFHIDVTDDGYRLLCIDGKEENGTGRKYCSSQGAKVRNTQTLHIYDATNQVCIASEPIDKKTNEIPTAQRILKTMELKRTLCTFDALHMQRETLKIICGKHGHYVGGLKGNQQGLHEEAMNCFSDEICQRHRKSQKKEKPIYIKSICHGHGQIEIREYFLVPSPENKERDEKWDSIKSYVLCIKTMVPDNPAEGTKIESRYYASD